MNQPDAIHCSLFVFLAFVMSGVAQTLWLRSRASRRFTAPLDGGRTLRGRRIFGDNKTWRGFVVMIPATGLAFLVAAILLPASRDPLDGSTLGPWPLSMTSYVLLGCWAGLGFMLGELPNSFLKRQLDVGPGDAPAHPLARTACFTLDQIDSIVGGLFALCLIVPVPLLSWVYILAVGACIHWLFNLVFMLLGLKARAA